MSNTILLGILRMPFDTKNDIHLIQLQHACNEAAYLVEAYEEKLEKISKIIDIIEPYDRSKDQHFNEKAKNELLNILDDQYVEDLDSLTKDLIDHIKNIRTVFC